MKQLLLFILLLCGIVANSQDLAVRKYSFGGGDGYSSVSQQFNNAVITGKNVAYAGDSVVLQLTLNALSDVNYEIKWYKEGNSTSLATGAQYTLNPVTSDQAGNYYCEITDFANAVTLTTAYFPLTVQANELTIDNIQLSKAILKLCEGNTDSLKVVGFHVNTGTCGEKVKKMIADKEYRVIYTWKKNGNVVTADAACKFVNAAASQSGTYTCEVEIVADGLFSAKASSGNCEVTIQRIPDLTLDPEGEVAVIFGRSMTLTASGAERYEWSNGSTDDRISVAPMERTTYTVKGYSSNGCYREKSVSVDVMRLELKTEGDRLIFKGDEITLSVTTNADSVLWYEVASANARFFRSASRGTLVGRGLTLRVSPRVTTTYNIYVYYQGAHTIVPVTVTVKDSFAGGIQDGFAHSCIAPSIIDQGQSSVEEMCKLKDIEMWIQPEGTNLKLEWQKLKLPDEVFVTYAPPAGTSVTGLGQNRLIFKEFTEENNGTYRCAVTNECGTVYSDTFFLSSRLAPVIYSRLNKDWSQCQTGNTAELNILAYTDDKKATTYTWYRADDYDQPFQIYDGPSANRHHVSIDLLDPKAEGLYRVVVANNCGADSSETFLTVIAPPKIDTMNTNVTVCKGETAEFFVRMKGNGSFSYRLMKGVIQSESPLVFVPTGEEWEGQSIVTIPNVQASGAYRWEITNECGVEYSPVVTLKVDLPLNWKNDIEQADTTLCGGENSRLILRTDVKTNVSEITYSWLKDGYAVPGQTSNRLDITGLTHADEGKYQCMAVNACPAIYSKKIDVHIYETPKLLASSQLKNYYCQGDSLHLFVVPTDQYKTDSIRWYLKGYRLSDRYGITGAGTDHLKIDSLEFSLSGVYIARLYNKCGYSESPEIKLNLNEEAHFVAGLQRYRSPLCLPEKLGITAAGTPPLRYKWLFNDEPILNEFLETTPSSILDSLDLNDIEGWDKSGRYTCHVQNSCGEEYTTVDLVFSRTDSFRFSGGGYYCEGGDGVSAVLNGSLKRVSYTLMEENMGDCGVVKAGTGDPIDFNGLKNGKFYIVSVDTLGCREQMPGFAIAEEEAYPRKFKTSIKRYLCENGTDGDILLEGSEEYMEYYLCRLNDDGKLDTLRGGYHGTGDPILMEYIPEGVYVVVARNPYSMCEVTMDDVIRLLPVSAPRRGELTAVDMNNIHCLGTDSDVKLKYSVFELGNTYTLKRNGVLLPETERDITPVVWTGVEAGHYTVTVKNEYGCQIDAGDMVVEGQPAPRVVNLSGESGVYCVDKATPRYLKLENTQPGVTYSFRAKVNDMYSYTYKDTLSRDGGVIWMEVPAEEREYYVIAIDSTPKHCEAEMNGRVTISRSRLEIVPPSGGVVKVKELEQATITVGVNNAFGNYKVLWRDPENLVTPYNQQTVTTVAIDKPIRYFVAVTDDMGCSVEAEVIVEPYGCAFKGWITNADGDTTSYERICRGHPVVLGTQWVCGGGVIDRYYYSCWYHYWYYWHWCTATRYIPYLTHYRWYDETGRLNNDNYSGPNNRYTSRISYAKKESGWIYCDIINGPDLAYSPWGTIIQRDPVVTRKDSVWVDVQESPAIYVVENPGLREVLLGEDVEIALHQSDPRVLYTLEYSEDGLNYEEVETLQGQSSSLSFIVTGRRMRWGYYRISAVLQNGGPLGLSCKEIMNGRVEIRRRGLHDHLEIERPMCTGDTDADLRITGSSEDAHYFLCRQNGEKWDTLSPYYIGTGEPISIQGVGPGVYQVVVRINYVDEPLSEIVEVKPLPSPEACDIYFAGNDSVVCWGVKSEIAIVNNCYTFGDTYTLIKDGVETDQERRSDPVLWMNLEAGNYKVKRTDKNGCSVVYGDRTVLLMDPPAIYKFAGDTKPYCEVREEGSRILTLASSDEGVRYSFLSRDDSTYVVDSLGTGGPLSINVPLVDRTYYVMAEDTVTGCKIQMDNELTIQRSPLSVTADRAIVKSRCGTAARLNITVRNATPPLSIEWNNEIMLAEGQKNAEDPWTLPLEESKGSVRFNVTVTDALNCVRTTEVLAECVPVPPPDETKPQPGEQTPNGGPLYAYIYDYNCANQVNKLVVSKYDYIDLCATGVGGSGDHYSYTWYDDEMGVISTARGLRNYNRLETGYLRLRITTPDGQTAEDEVLIIVDQEDDGDDGGDGGIGDGTTLFAEIYDRNCSAPEHYKIASADESIVLCAHLQGGTGQRHISWLDRNRNFISDRVKLRGYSMQTSGWIYLRVTAGTETVEDKIWIEIQNGTYPQPTPIPPVYPDDPEYGKVLAVTICDAMCGTDAGDRITVESSTRINLCANVYGGKGVRKVTWLDKNKRPINNLRGLRGFTMSSSGYIYLWAEDEAGGFAEDKIWVDVKDSEGWTEPEDPPAGEGGVLSCTIRDKDCNAQLDTIHLCQGEKLMVCSNVKGGLGRYSFRWSTPEKGTISIARGFQADKNESGYLFLEVSTADDGQVAYDTAWVEVEKMPLAFHVQDAGLLCDLPDNDMEIKLEDSETGVSYRLEYSENAYAYTPVAGKEEIGFNGRPLKFVLNKDEKKWGFYRITARFGDNKSCFTQMYGELEVRRQPEKYNIFGGWEYCEGHPLEGTITVDSSQVGVDYHLMRAPGAKVISAVGTGDTLRFIEKLTYGTYYVIAQINRCQEEMNGEVEVTLKRKPDIGSIYSGRYCESADPLKIQVPESRDGIKYVLNRYQFGLFAEQMSDTLPGVDMSPLIFGTYNKVGDYEIVAIDEAQECVFEYEGPHIMANVGLKDVQMEMEHCIPAGGQGWVKLVDLDSSLIYVLSTPGSEQRIGGYIGDYLLSPAAPGRYSVKVVNPQTTCETEAKFGYINPAIPAGGIDPVIYYCNGTDDPYIQLNAVYPGIRYELYQLFFGMEIELETLYSPQTRFADRYPEGDYLLKKVREKSPGDTTDTPPCTDVIPFKIQQRTPPAFVKTTPEDGTALRLCPGDKRVISMSELREGVDYILEYTSGGSSREVARLNLADTLSRCDTIGYNYPPHYWYDGYGHRHVYYILPPRNPLSFGKYNGEGWYKIYADNGCRRLLTTFRIIQVRPPQGGLIFGEDRCVVEEGLDSIKVGIANPEPYISYNLYNGDKLMDSLAYNADNYYFKAQTEIGCYHVVAMTNTPTCNKPMEGSVCLSTTPSVYEIMENGVQYICNEGDSITLTLRNSQIGTRYVVYKDHEETTITAEGTNDILTIGKVSEPGIYSVKAKVGACVVAMEGEVWLKLADAPVPHIGDSVRYCEGLDGAEIVLKSPTYDTITYRIYDPEGTQLYEVQGRTDNEEIVVTDRYNYPYVTIEATESRYGCRNTKEVYILQDKMPVKYKLTGTNKEYICPDSSTELFLEGSEEGVEYTLYETVSGLQKSVVLGTGDKLSFGTVKDLGVYRVEAELLVNRECKLPMLNDLNLRKAMEIIPYDVQTETKYYCQSPVGGGEVSLSSSQSQVSYELYKNGEPTGLKKDGFTGTRLMWSGLEGELCEKVGEEEETGGHRYTVVATDTNSGCRQEMKGRGLVIQMQDPAILASSPNLDIAVCEGESLYMNAFGFGCDLTYELYKDNRLIVRNDTGAYYIPAVSMTRDLGVYYWRAYNGCDTVTRNTFEVKERGQLLNTKRLGTVSLCKETGNTLKLVSGFRNALGTKWYKAGDTTVIGRGPILILNNLTKDDVGDYVCSAWNECNHEIPQTDTCHVTYGKPVVPVEIRKDTVCFGTPVTYRINTLDNVEWLLDGEPIGAYGSEFKIRETELANEGRYSVRISNNCGDSLYVFADLFVDDTISVVDITQDQIKCVGDFVDLFVKTSPEKRVTYTWEVGDSIVSHAPHYLAGPLETRQAMTYRVFFTNKCTLKQEKGYRDVKVVVPKEIIYNNPADPISFCADCTSDTVLRLHTDPGILADFEWFYRKAVTDVDRVLKDSKADTLLIKMCSSSSGFYYCRIHNVCQSVTVHTSWVKVDSMPALVGEWPTEGVACIGSPYTVRVAATGGSMNYTLNIQYADGRRLQQKYYFLAFDSQAEMTFPAVTQDMDGAEIWWELKNNCGQLETPHMTLTVKPAPEIEIAPRDTTFCQGEDVKLRISLKNGVAPWEYGFRVDNEETLHKVTGVTGDLAELKVDSTAVYNFVYMRDADNCEVPEFKIPVSVYVREKSTVNLSAEPSVCEGDSVHLKVNFVGGEGPWSITINRRSKKENTVTEANEIGTFPMLIHSRDTVMAFKPLRVDTLDYFVTVVSGIIGGGAVECSGTVGTTAHVEVKGRDLISYTRLTNVNDRHFSGCNLTDLFDKFNPQPRKDDGKFVLLKFDTIDGRAFVAGKEELVLGLFDKYANGEKIPAGHYYIRYEHMAENGCLSYTFPENGIEIWRDSLPEAKIEAKPKNLCVESGSAGRFEITLRGAAPFKASYNILRYNWDMEFVESSLKSLERLAEGTKMLDFGAVSARDDFGRSIYKLTSVSDRHGCFWPGAPQSDTITSRLRPTYDVSVSYKNFLDGEWMPGATRMFVEEGDSVKVAYGLVRGFTPWKVEGVEVTTDEVFIHEMEERKDTTWFKSQGIWDLKICDKYCKSDQIGMLDLQTVVPGYLKVKALLEGPYNSLYGEMETLIQDVLPTYGKPLPDVGQPIIDWVTLELRRRPDTLPMALDSCLLLADGTVVDREGNDVLEFPGLSATGSVSQYYVVLKQRNHLPVMSVPMILDNRKPYAKTVDFTKLSTIYTKYPSSASMEEKIKNMEENHMTKVKKNGTDIWALSAGEVNDNQTVTVFDPNQVALETNGSNSVIPNPLTYESLLYDLNFNGKVEWKGSSLLDWKLAAGNRNKYTEVPLLKK